MHAGSSATGFVPRLDRREGRFNPTLRGTRPVGITVVLTAGHRGYRVTCTCGAFDGKRYLLRGSAVADAYLHAAANNCIPAQPLIDPHVSRAN